MENASPAMFRPTWRQALGRGLYLGGIISAVMLFVAALLVLTVDASMPAPWWLMAGLGPITAGALVAVPAGRLSGTQISAGGIRTVSAVPRRCDRASWDEVVDLRAERRGGRTVISVYLDSGGSLQLRAPYSGELFAADPRFERKVFTLSHLWRTHRFGGLPG